MSEKVKVFVYGTLRRGNSNHFRRLDVEGSKFIGEGKTTNEFNMTAHVYPMVSRTKENNTQIIGELFEVDEEIMHGSLDRLEGHPTFFERVTTEIEMDDGTKEEAWMYFLDKNDNSEHVPSGDFNEYLKTKKW